MLLNEFLKEHCKVESLESTIAQQQSTNAEQQKAIETLKATLKEQAAQLRKVSDRLEGRPTAPRLVSNQ